MQAEEDQKIDEERIEPVEQKLVPNFEQNFWNFLMKMTNVREQSDEPRTQIIFDFDLMQVQIIEQKRKFQIQNFIENFEAIVQCFQIVFEQRLKFGVFQQTEHQIKRFRFVLRNHEQKTRQKIHSLKVIHFYFVAFVEILDFNVVQIRDQNERVRNRRFEIARNEVFVRVSSLHIQIDDFQIFDDFFVFFFVF